VKTQVTHSALKSGLGLGLCS